MDAANNTEVMTPEQHIELIEHAQAWRTLASRPLAYPTRERPWKLTVLWNDVGHSWHGMGLYFATLEEAERAFTVLCKFFPDQIDVECSGDVERERFPEDSKARSRQRACSRASTSKIAPPHHQALSPYVGASLTR